MKKIKLNSDKLKFKKKVIANLSNDEMKHVLGGGYGSTGAPCNSYYCNTHTTPQAATTIPSLGGNPDTCCGGGGYDNDSKNCGTRWTNDFACAQTTMISNPCCGK